MRNFESIVIVGSSGSGKTTLVDGLRGHKYRDKLIIPRRHITRPEREGDNLAENTHTNKEEFARKVGASLIYPYWTRPLNDGRLEQYGFDAVGLDDGRLRVYSANNAFMRDKNPSVISVLEKSLVVVAMSGLESRARRLQMRSPDISEAERTVRLDDDGTDVLNIDTEAEVVNTTALTPSEGQSAMRRIVDEILASDIAP
jgi:GTPase SAR1 family protein